jgi:urease alpha subunit
MLGSDSQGMGRIHEVICRTWQLVDGVLATCEPAREVPLARRYMLR